MSEETKDQHFRDDAKDQPESGYPEGRVSTKPSADLDQDKQETQKGSEAEFDSERAPRRGG